MQEELYKLACNRAKKEGLVDFSIKVPISLARILYSLYEETYGSDWLMLRFDKLLVNYAKKHKTINCQQRQQRQRKISMYQQRSFQC